jgi:hypothetical protein
VNIHDIISSEIPSDLLALAGKQPADGNIDLSRAKQIDVDRDHYLEAQAQGISLTELLESDPYDPSPVDSPLDAFERQLLLKGIRSSGRNPVTVELFYRNAPMLMPEFMMREIKRGMSMRSDYRKLPASSSTVSTNRYTPLYIDASATDDNLSLRPVGEGAEIPQIVVTEQRNTVTVPDYGIAPRHNSKCCSGTSDSSFRLTRSRS